MVSREPAIASQSTAKHPFISTEFEQIKLRRERIYQYLFLGMAVMLVVPVLAILTFLTMKAWPSLTWAFVTSNPADGMTAGGIWAPLFGTFLLVLCSLLIAAPIGVLAGVYLNEYARDNWVTRIINLSVVNLAGVPSIVHGLFGLGAFVYFAQMRKSLIAASCTVAVMTLPVIIASTKEALAAVPMSFRVACWNMGASRWQTIRTIVLPNSISGILTGVILQVSRAAGETAPILFTGVAFYINMDQGFALNEKFMALSFHLFTISKQVQNVPESIQYGTAVVLIGLVLVVNSVSIAFRIYLRNRKKW
ncbi:MAG: phosphate ABC transporter permease PstA [Planctomycetota bacterium]|nr:phosphate ABC transporter permease PstA [Planctomycetota bacterium]